MNTTETETFEAWLTRQDEPSWLRALGALLPVVHPSDRDSTRIWFAFWPLQLYRIVRDSKDLERTAQRLELQGGYRLEEQLGSSLAFLCGSRHWKEVREAVVSQAGGWDGKDAELERLIRDLVARLAGVLQVPESHLIGITAIAVMALRQVGRNALSACSVAGPPALSPEKACRARDGKKRGLLRFLRTVDARHTVVFDERDPGSRFQAIHGQDISMAAGQDVRDYRPIDPRRTEGPVPFQCRVGTCGTCWVGLLGGKERLSPITDSERRGLERFGYDFGSSPQETHPPIRLACQARCLGDVSIAIAPWNGVLNVRRFEGI